MKIIDRSEFRRYDLAGTVCSRFVCAASLELNIYTRKELLNILREVQTNLMWDIIDNINY